MRLYVFIEINGKSELVGQIDYTSSIDACFSYDLGYLQKESPAAISISLPLQEERFSPETTKNFFDGLLPEGFTRQVINAAILNNSDDYISMLKHLGSECLGAITISEKRDIGDSLSYEKLTLADVANLAKEGQSKSSNIIVGSHLSLAGASGKVGLYFNEKNNEWYQPLNFAPSTHIVKQSNVNYKRIVLNEQLCMLAAKNFGLDVPDSFILSAGSIDDDEILFATKRFDRKFSIENKYYKNLRVPYRLHQEDFSQVMSIKSADKYDPNGDYFIKMLNLIRQVCANPIEDTQKFIDYVMFNWLIGNNDGHIKNFSLLYDESLSKICLSPAYDMVSSYCYNNVQQNLNAQFAFSVGDDKILDKINVDSFRHAVKLAGYNENLIDARFNRFVLKFQSSLTLAGLELVSEGFNDAEDFVKIILEKSKKKLNQC